jgi:hypothetical protein
MQVSNTPQPTPKGRLPPIDPSYFAKYNLHYDEEKKLYRVGTTSSFVHVERYAIQGEHCMDDLAKHVGPHIMPEQVNLIVRMAGLELVSGPIPVLCKDMFGKYVKFINKYASQIGPIEICYGKGNLVDITWPNHEYAEFYEHFAYFNRDWILRNYAAKLGIDIDKSIIHRKLSDLIRAKMIEVGEPIEVYDSMAFHIKD